MRGKHHKTEAAKRIEFFLRTSKKQKFAMALRVSRESVTVAGCRNISAASVKLPSRRG
jgi:urease alpha subunit